MRPQDRHEEIIRLVTSAGQATVDWLASRLDVSKETLRRDLTQLDSKGRIQKYHGGARVRALSKSEVEVEGSFAARMNESRSAKVRIAARAAKLLGPGDSLFVDTGTTTLMFAEALINLPSLTVITNSGRIAATVSANADHKVFLLGGSYSSDAGETVGPMALEHIRKFRAKYAFLTIGAASDSGVLDFDEQEAEVAKAMLERVDKACILADALKFSRTGVFEVAPWSSVDHLITNRPIDLLPRSVQSSGVDVMPIEGEEADRQLL